MMDVLIAFVLRCTLIGFALLVLTSWVARTGKPINRWIILGLFGALVIACAEWTFR